MITALGASPSLDVTYVVDDYRIGEIHRPRSVIRVAGGKALNASRAATLLGADVRAIALLGGALGDAVCADAKLSGVAVTRIDTEAETRECVSVLSLEGDRLTEVYEHPSPVTAAEWSRALEATAAALDERTGWLMISGGMPASLGENALVDVLEVARRAGSRVALDSHGAALRAALEQGDVALLKVNRAEAAEVLDLPADSPLLDLARALQCRTSGAVVVTDGVGGAIGVDTDGSAVHVSLPGHTGAYPVGSGDSFLGALVVALDAGHSLESGMRSGTAAATANAMVPGAARFTRAEADALLPDVRVIPIGARP